MKAINNLLISTLLIMCNPAFSQSKNSLPTLSIGSSMSNYTIKNLINYPKKNIETNELKGKIIILDFWSRGCVVCMESWPKLMQLQEDFKDQIQIITVNIYEDENKIKALLEEREKIFKYKMTLPIACGDPSLKQLFPHIYVPHVVFIGPDGVVKYITSGNDLNRETIENMIAGKINIPQKTDTFIPVDWRKPIFVNGNGGNEENGGKLLFTTAIKMKSNNISGYAVIEKRQGYTYGALINTAVVNMFRFLYGPINDQNGKQLYLSNAAIQLAVTDSSKLVASIKGSLISENHYGIQVTIQKEVSVNTIKQKMISDLELYFDLKTYWKKQRKNCIVLTRTNTPLTVYRNGPKTLGIGLSKIMLNKVSVKEFIEELASNQLSKVPYPIVDETGFEGLLGEILIEENTKNPMALSRVLNQHGLKLMIEEREVDVLVITDNK